METLSKRLPTPDETKKASEATTALGRSLTESGSLRLNVVEDGAEVQIELPPAIGALMLDLLAHVARGEMVTLVPYSAELTTQKAADLLNVSRPFLTKLLESGEINYRMVGSHRRVKADDLLTYMARRGDARSDALKELQNLGQEYDAG